MEVNSQEKKFNSKLNLNKINDLKTSKQPRNYGIDLLKYIAMINIINLHINMHTSYDKLRPNNPKYKPIYRLESFSFWPVNAFGLISGIVGYKKYKFTNVIYIWFQYCFYSVTFTIYLYYKSLANVNNIFLSFLPFGNRRNWYVNAYILMYLFLPFMTNSINTLDKRFYSKIVLYFFFIYSIYHVFIKFITKKGNHDFIIGGYSSLWLLILYISGGCIARFYINRYIISDAVLILIYFIASFLTSEYIFYKGSTLFLEYISPTIVIQALSLVLFFANLKIKNKIIIKVILFFVPLNFSVNIIHTRIFLMNIPLRNKFFKYIESLKPQFLFFKIYTISIIIYFICITIDYIRLLLFKILRIRKLSNFIEKIII